jgi:alkylated DNA repair protein (DNA oxidative demethylase)
VSPTRPVAGSTPDLFAGSAPAAPGAPVALAPGAFVLPRLALADAPALLDGVHAVLAQAPLRHWVTPGGLRMSVAMSNCGALGWVSDRTGYRYDARDPTPDRPGRRCRLRCANWRAVPPPLPAMRTFVPDACLINRYEPGARLSLHQDRDERDLGQPIVSVSLGLPAMFVFGGAGAATRRGVCRWSMAMGWCGAGRRGCSITGCWR